MTVGLNLTSLIHFSIRYRSSWVWDARKRDGYYKMHVPVKWCNTERRIRFDLSIHKRLGEIVTTSQDPTRGKQSSWNDRLVGTNNRWRSFFDQWPCDCHLMCRNVIWLLMRCFRVDTGVNWKPCQNNHVMKESEFELAAVVETFLFSCKDCL